MKLGPLLCGRKARRFQIVPRNIFRGVGLVVQHVRPVGAVDGDGVKGALWVERR